MTYFVRENGFSFLARHAAKKPGAYCDQRIVAPWAGCECIHVGRIEDARLLKEAGFYLAVRAQMPESKLIEGVPRVLKIASRDVTGSVRFWDG